MKATNQFALEDYEKAIAEKDLIIEIEKKD